MFNIFKKPNPKIVAELEALLENSFERDKFLFGFQTAKADELEKFHKDYFEKSITDSFAENWKNYIIGCGGNMQKDKAYELVGIAYNVVSATEQTAIQKYEADELKTILEVKPHSRFREDFYFDQFDYAILLRKLSANVESHKIYKVNLVRECVELII